MPAGCARFATLVVQITYKNVDTFQVEGPIMNHDEYTNKLAQRLGPEARERILGEVGLSVALKDAPFNNFFADDFLTLLYRSKEPSTHPLDRIKELLLVVSNKSQPRHVRAAAALALGRFVDNRYPDDKYVSGNSRPEQWFHLARQLNSVVGAWELANAKLASCNLRIEFDLNVDPLPHLVQADDQTWYQGLRLDQEVAQAWYLGARVALRHVQRDFSGWDQECFGCALACIVNYMTLIPPGRQSLFACPAQQRRQALLWIKSLWNRLIDASSQHAYDSQAHRAALIEQQLAVFLYLDELEKNGAPADNKAKSASAAAPKLRKAGANEILIVPGDIPTSSDRAERDYLKQFEVLRQPLKFRTLPSLESLYALRKTLISEFPWAQEPISLVTSDLFARRRHGVLRLGMAPVLLVGPPSSGKTRFAQRLSELLDTPSTVINLSGMSDVKMLKGVTRGWASNRPSRIVEFIQQTLVPNPLFILDEIDKTGMASHHGGDPQDALLDLLEPGNAKRYSDIYLMAECDLSYCSYIATSNTIDALSAPLLSRLRPVLFPSPGPEHSNVILKGILRDLELSWSLPHGVLTVTPHHAELMRGLSAREMRRALLELLGSEVDEPLYTQH